MNSKLIIMRRNLLFLSLIFILVFTACQSGQKKDNQSSSQLPHGTHEATVSEVIQTASYTYLLAKEADVENWIAIPQKEVTVGQTIFYDEGLEMKNFESKSLGRVFETVYFVQGIRDVAVEPVAEAINKKLNKKVGIAQSDISVDQPAGAQSVAQVFKNKTDNSGQQITIRGQVVKVNNGIMGVNWLHIQDGSSHEGDFDLTVTTDQFYQVGDVVTLLGTISLNKDFGAGYKYPVIMEQAVKVVNQ